MFVYSYGEQQLCKAERFCVASLLSGVVIYFSLALFMTCGDEWFFFLFFLFFKRDLKKQSIKIPFNSLRKTKGRPFRDNKKTPR